MKVDNVVEHEDGTATLELSDISQEELQFLVEEGFKSLISKRLAEDAEQRKIPALCKA